MKARTISRHFRESFKSLIRNGWMTFASVSAVTVTLLLVGVFTALMLNMNKAATDIENDVEMNVYIEIEADEVSVSALEDQITDLSGVESVTYSSKEEELSSLIDSFGDEMALFEQNNPLRDKFIVKATDPRQTERLASQITTIENIAAVEYGEDKIDQLFETLEVSRNVGAVLIFGLLFTAMFLISNTIKITIVARRREIEIMKLVGASNWFVRFPFLLEGIWLGIIGAILPIAVVSVLYYNVYEFMEPRLENSFIQILEFTPFIYQINALILLMGVVIGMWGSFMSVRKFLKV
ncbi:permease-like cell division protein FtsX [Jeotgalibacillus sp. ET6]|uniref:permease-like cell division protein FtsX n=1 Tax=Jeotgalibacillus sp. ET6 TaxID=3037260 RepID=UPI0024189793|nr:permease-like cell division protein FtsX [Jeotgalibacillus sp. ET6]MDG5471641.1 permease-like cell division protein FtsX [Jeotgalibacillus sp. ET6]